MPEPRRIYEDNHIIVVDKPAGMATMGADPNAPSLHRWLCGDIKRRYQKPGKVFLGVVSRLDRDTTGVIVLARTSKAASRLTPQFGAASTTHGRSKAKAKNEWPPAVKSYLAIVQNTGAVKSISAGEHYGWIDRVRKNEARRRMETIGRSITQTVDSHWMPGMPGASATSDVTGTPVDGGRDDGQRAVSRVEVVQTHGPWALLRIRLFTGRKHQIRLQSAARGLPIVGDSIYGDAPPQLRPNDHRPALALHCERLVITHPTHRTSQPYQAPPPRSWQTLMQEINLRRNV